jgi:hypothetical protein
LDQAFRQTGFPFATIGFRAKNLIAKGMTVVWQDRDYNQGGYGDAGDYLANPSGILGLSVPFGTWFGVRVRLHFWLLISFVFLLASLFRQGSPTVVAMDIGLTLAALLLHDFGHRAFGTWVGAELNEFMLWPAGGMEFPKGATGPRRIFIAFVGGITVNLLLAIGSFVAFHVLTGEWLPIPIRDPLMSLGSFPLQVGWGPLLLIAVSNFAYLNWGLVIANILPYFWFDGGFLWRVILQPMVGSRMALNVTCIVGMIFAATMVAFSLAAGDLLMMFIWGFLFSSAYTSRTHMAMDSEYEDYSDSFAGNSGTSGRIQSGRWPAKASLRAAAKRRQEEAKIDEILAKVSAHGMHSLTWLEKRTLRKGSQRLR